MSVLIIEERSFIEIRFAMALDTYSERIEALPPQQVLEGSKGQCRQVITVVKSSAERKRVLDGCLSRGLFCGVVPAPSSMLPPFVRDRLSALVIVRASRPEDKVLVTSVCSALQVGLLRGYVQATRAIADSEDLDGEGQVGVVMVEYDWDADTLYKLARRFGIPSTIVKR